jgi:CRISPR-associated protein Csx10
MSKHWPLPERFRIRLSMQSDWHVGSGMGRPGNIDRLIARDADDLPFVPAKTLRGIWRDACERLCRGLDDGRLGAWSRLVDQLFGSQPGLADKDPTERHNAPANAPLGSAVQVGAARIPPSLRQQLARADRRLRQALTFIKPGVKIDRRSGSAQTDFLRFEEVARKGTILEAECRLLVDAPNREVASALLIASAKLVERLGGKRRRGPGRCRLEILEADTDAALAWLDRTASPPNWSPIQPRDTSSDTRYVAPPTDLWLCVLLTLRLQEPLAVSYRTIGNVVETLDFVLGSYLLPHVTHTLSGLGLDVRSAFQSGDVCVLPAYPEVDSERGQPVPMAWFAPKGVDKPLQIENREWSTACCKPNRLTARSSSRCATGTSPARRRKCTSRPSPCGRTTRSPTSRSGRLKKSVACTPTRPSLPVTTEPRSCFAVSYAFANPLPIGWGRTGGAGSTAKSGSAAPRRTTTAALS